MANYNASRVKHATLTAATVDVVTLGQAYRQVEVLNRSTTDPIYVTIDRGGPASPATITPTVGGDECYYVGPNSVRILSDDQPAATPSPSTVRLIGAAASGYTITGLH